MLYFEKMNRREIRSTRSPTPPMTTSIRRHSSGYGRNRQKHLVQQRQQRLEEQRARTDTPILKKSGLLLVPAATGAANSKEEDCGLKKNAVAPPSRNVDLQKKMTVAALSEAMSGSPRKHHSSSLVQAVHHQIGHLPRYGSKSLSAVGRSQQHKNETVKEAPLHLSHSSHKSQLNTVSSDSTAHTVQISDDEISSDASSNRSTSMEADTDDILGVVTSTDEVEDVIASKDTDVKKEATRERNMVQQQLEEAKNEMESVMIEHTKAKAEIQAKQEVINQLTKDLAFTKNNIGTKDTSILKLEMQNKALIDEKEDLTAKIKLHESELTELTASHRTLQFDKGTFETNNIKTVTDLEEKVARLTNEIDNNSSENSALRGDVRRLERELQESKEELNCKLVSMGDEGPVSEKQSLLEKSICEKNKKIQHLGCDLSAAQFESRKLQSKIDQMTIAFETALAELTALKEWKITSEQLLNEKDITAEETKTIQRECLQQKDSIISSLHDQLNEEKEELKDIKKSVNAKDEMISSLEEMVASLRDQLNESKDELEDCKKSKIEQEVQLNLQMETQLKEAKIEQESIQKHLTELQEANSNVEVSLVEKSVIISTLSSNTKRLEAELEDCKEFYAKKMLDLEKQTTTLKPTRQMESELRTKEVEIELLKIELKRVKGDCSKLSSSMEPISSEIAELKTWKKNAQETIRKQQVEHKEFVDDRMSCIQALEQRLQATEDEATMRYEVELLNICKERDHFRNQVEVKDGEISRIKAEKDEIVKEMKTLANWKEEALSNLKAKEREVMVLEIAARRNLEFETELERQRAKYERSRTALLNMENALQAIEGERKRLLGHSSQFV